MPRANRHFLPDLVWHITHRCHEREFLLRFHQDRKRWRRWLYEARKRYGLCILDYIVTSNHVHLLVRDRGQGEIPRSMQLIAGRTGQAFNHRKGRKGAFWEDRYHATAVQTGDHLAVYKTAFRNGRPLRLNWPIRLEPVLHPQSGHALEFSLVIGDDRGAESQGVRRDQEVVRADALSGLFELQTEPPVFAVRG